MGITDSRDEAFMRLAMAQAQQAAEAGEVPVGAVVVLGDQVVAQAHNQVISQNNPAAHAEVLALSQAGESVGNYRLPQCELYVTLEPCTMCAGVCIHSRIKRLVYGASDPKTGVIESVDQLLNRPYHNHQLEVKSGVLKSACGALLSSFFGLRRQQQKALKSKRKPS